MGVQTSADAVVRSGRDIGLSDCSIGRLSTMMELPLRRRDLVFLNFGGYKAWRRLRVTCTSLPASPKVVIFAHQPPKPPPNQTFNMQYKLIALVGCLAAAVSAQDSSSGGGIVLTSKQTNTDVGRSTTFVPVTTAVVKTTSNVEVSTSLMTISKTSDVGRTPGQWIDGSDGILSYAVAN